MRTTSFKDVSVGIGLALETLAYSTESRINPEREIPASEHLDLIDSIYIDIFTLTLDVIRSSTILPSPKEVIDLTKLMIVGIESIPELSGIVKFINTTDYLMLDSTILKTFKKDSKVEAMFKLHMASCRLIPHNFTYVPTLHMGGKNALLLSSNTNWLGTMKNLKSNLRVLESHTGNVLTELTLNKKYKKRKSIDTSKIPFDKMLLLFLGDGHYIKGMDSKDIPDLLNELLKWNSKTSRDTITSFLIKNYPEQYNHFKRK